MKYHSLGGIVHLNTLPYVIHISKVESTRDHGRACVSTCNYRHDSVFETLWDRIDY